MDSLPTLAEVLRKPDAEILRTGLYVKVMVREWKRITGSDPAACDCVLPSYLKTVRKHHRNDA